MSDSETSSLRWSVHKRLEFLEFRLFWYARFNRTELSEKFGMSAQQASADIALYQQLAPNNLAYDHVQKAYLRTHKFSPRFVGASADRFLLQIVAIKSRWMQREETWFEDIPPVEVVGLKRQPTDHEHLLAVHDAIRNRHEISIDYQSMTGTAGSSRVVAPHAMANSAGRWYIRAWSRDHNDFRDYNLSRIRAVGDTKPCGVDQSLDYEWAQKIDLILIPNPKLSAATRRAVELEHAMDDGQLVVPMRLSLSFYLMRELDLDIAPDILPPERQQLILCNRDDVEQARRLARQMSKQALERAQPS